MADDSQLIDCSAYPPPLEDAPVSDVERLYASVLCMVDELQRARLPYDLDCRTLAQASWTMLVDLSTALLAWIAAQEEPADG